ncbi:MAG: alpha/beta fold hydrolase [Rhodospirillaceae bacterium]
MTEPVTLASAETGGGDPLIILHGLFGSKRNWGVIAKALAADRRVICLDMRNHGESPWAEPMTYPAMAADVAAFIQDIATGPVDLMGHSMGGKAAMMLALMEPDLINRLIVVDIAPSTSPGTFIHYAKALKAMDLGAVGSRKDADALLAPTEPNPDIRAFLLQNLESGADGFRWRVNLDGLAASMEDLLAWPAPGAPAFDKPSLFLAGGASDYVTPDHHAGIRSLFADARIETMPGVGHWAHAEAPGLFLDHVGEFLAA